MKYDVVIVGGGLAGLTASICLSQSGFKVLVLEKNRYPNHKVCGEYISNEVRPFLEFLGLDLKALDVVPIESFSMSNRKGKKLHCKLPLGGFGISRYTLDHALYELALKKGVDIRFEMVSTIEFKEDGFNIATKSNSYQSAVAIGAYGKRSALDKSLKRPFIHSKSPWLGIKAHYTIKDFSREEVSLHSFPGGYGGLSMVEGDKVNFCYLAHYKNFQRFGNIDEFNANIVVQNPLLKKFLDRATPVLEAPLSIAQISFTRKETVEGHMLMCGDSAGLIHPLCGNGMAMAIHSAKIASDRIARYLKEERYSREHMERDYQKIWSSNFNRRLYFGRRMQYAITNTLVMDHFFSYIPNSQRFLSATIKLTHGKPILV